MRSDKLSLLDEIFSDWGYYIKDDRAYNSKNIQIGFECKSGRNKGLKMVTFSHENKLYGYTLNEVLAWNEGKFEEIEKPEAVFVKDDLTFIDNEERLKENRSKSEKIKAKSEDHEKRMNKAVYDYINTGKTTIELSKEYKIERNEIRKEVKFVCGILGIKVPTQKRNSKGLV